MSKQLKLIVRRKNLRAADARRGVPSIFSLAGTKVDFEIARMVVFVDDDGEEITMKRAAIGDELLEFEIVERPITPASTQAEIQTYLADLQKKLGESNE